MVKVQQLVIQVPLAYNKDTCLQSRRFCIMFSFVQILFLQFQLKCLFISNSHNIGFFEENQILLRKKIRI